MNSTNDMAAMMGGGVPGLPPQALPPTVTTHPSSHINSVPPNTNMTPTMDQVRDETREMLGQCWILTEPFCFSLCLKLVLVKTA